MKIQMPIPRNIKGASRSRHARHCLDLLRRQVGEPTRFQSRVVNRHSSLDQNHPFVHAVPMRREHVSRRIPREQLKGARLSIFPKDHALRSAAFHLPLRCSRIHDHHPAALRQQQPRHHNQNRIPHVATLQSLCPSVLEKYDIALKKMAGQIRVPAQQRGRSLARKVSEVSNQMSLVVIPAPCSPVRPGEPRNLHRLEHPLEPLDTAEHLRRHANLIQKSPLELPYTQSAIARHISHRSHTARRDYGGYRLANHTPFLACRPLQNSIDKTVLSDASQFPFQSRSNLFEWNHPAGQLIHGQSQNPSSPSRTKSHPKHPRRPGGPDQHRPRNLSREETSRLLLPPSLPHALKRTPKVQDQLRAPIRNNPLNISRPPAIVLENPIALNESRRRRARSHLSIFHLESTVSRSAHTNSCSAGRYQTSGLRLHRNKQGLRNSVPAQNNGQSRIAIRDIHRNHDIELVQADVVRSEARINDLAGR
jgi:hypothetical protein